MATKYMSLKMPAETLASLITTNADEESDQAGAKPVGPALSTLLEWQRDGLTRTLTTPSWIS